MSSHHVVQFSDPLRAIYPAGTPPPAIYTLAELEAARREGYHRGAEETSKTLERQMLEQRSELVHLQSDTFVAVQEQHASLFEQFRAILPQLVMEAVARILGGTQPDREILRRVVDDLLGELAPTGEAVEVQLNAHDLELIGGYEANLRDKFPGLCFKASAELQPGDAIVRSRFGVVDGRLGTKFKAVEAMFQ